MVELRRENGMGFWVPIKGEGGICVNGTGSRLNGKS